MGQVRSALKSSMSAASLAMPRPVGTGGRWLARRAPAAGPRHSRVAGAAVAILPYRRITCVKVSC